MSLADKLAAQVWCKPETSGIEMDVRLAIAIVAALREYGEAVRAADAETCRNNYVGMTSAPNTAPRLYRTDLADAIKQMELP